MRKWVGPLRYSWIRHFWKVLPFIAIIPISFSETKPLLSSVVDLTHSQLLLFFYIPNIPLISPIPICLLNSKNKKTLNSGCNRKWLIQECSWIVPSHFAMFHYLIRYDQIVFMIKLIGVVFIKRKIKNMFELIFF